MVLLIKTKQFKNVQCTHLTDTEKSELGQVSTKYQHLFDGSLGTWKTEPIELEMDPKAKPYHAKPPSSLLSGEETQRWNWQNMLLWGTEGKSTDGNGQNWTKGLKGNHFLFNIQKNRAWCKTAKTARLIYASSLDMIMWYNHIELSPNSSRYCTIEYFPGVNMSTY